MKIEKITPFLVDSFLLVRVYTDEGLVGNGEAGLWAHQKTVHETILELSEYYVSAKTPLVSIIIFRWFRETPTSWGLPSVRR